MYVHVQHCVGRKEKKRKAVSLAACRLYEAVIAAAAAEPAGEGDGGGFAVAAALGIAATAAVRTCPATWHDMAAQSVSTTCCATITLMLKRLVHDRVPNLH